MFQVVPFVSTRYSTLCRITTGKSACVNRSQKHPDNGQPFPNPLREGLPPLTREERARRAKLVINTRFNSKQQAFLDFVLAHYVGVGVDELDQEKLTPLLRLKYSDSISDAIADLGKPEDISKVFVRFQKYLYEPNTTTQTT
jgi:hypothetical protein